MTDQGDTAQRTGPLMLRILAVLANRGPMPRRDVVNAVAGDTNRQAAYRSLTTLRTRGLVADGRGLPPAEVSITAAGRSLLATAGREAGSC